MELKVVSASSSSSSSSNSSSSSSAKKIPSSSNSTRTTPTTSTPTPTPTPHSSLSASSSATHARAAANDGSSSSSSSNGTDGTPNTELEAVIPVSVSPGVVPFFESKGIVSVQAGTKTSLLLGSRGGDDELSTVYILSSYTQEVNVAPPATGTGGGSDAAAAAAANTPTTAATFLTLQLPPSPSTTTTTAARPTTPVSPAAPSPQTSSGKATSAKATLNSNTLDSNATAGTTPNNVAAGAAPSSPTPTPTPTTPSSSGRSSPYTRQTDEQQAGVAGLKSLIDIAHVGFVRYIACGGTSFGIVAQKSGKDTALGMALRELASTEMMYVNQLRAAIRHGLLPAYKSLAKEDGSSDEVKRQTFEKILNLCSEVWQASCVTAGSLGGMSTRGAVMEVATLFDALQPPLLYGNYATSYSDAIANGTMRHLPIVRLVDDSLLKIKCTGVVKQEDGPAEALLRLVLLPIERMAAYESFCQRLSFLSYKGGLASAELARAAEQWIQLSEALKIALVEADTTAKFWDDYPGARKTFATPMRRIVKHSREAPLHTRGLLSGSTWFLLFNDAFVVSQMFGTREMPLGTLWVSDIPDSLSFTIITPVETLEVYTNSHDAKSAWIAAVTRCICKCVDAYDENAMCASMGLVAATAFSGTVPIELELYQLERRKAHHYFKDHHLYGSGHYHGDMHMGKLDGEGVLTCVDGRVYAGQFIAGQCDGYVEMESPQGVTAIKTAKGEWREGRLHGRAKVEYHDGSIYDGNWIDGSRKGHGCSVSEMDNMYVGGWSAGMYTGYGVYIDALRGSTYLGMWEDGNRHGEGTVVLKDGVFYTGMFSNDQMVGEGQLLTEDDAEYVGEFAGECHLQGRGHLTLPNGDVFQGNFSGHWSDKAGVKVNGIFCRSLMSPTLSARERTFINAADGGSGQSAQMRTVEIKDPISSARRWSELFGDARQTLLQMRQRRSETYASKAAATSSPSSSPRRSTFSGGPRTSTSTSTSSFESGGGGGGGGGGSGGDDDDAPISRSSSMSSLGRGTFGTKASNGGSLADGLAPHDADESTYDETTAALGGAFDDPSHPLCRTLVDAAFAFKASYRHAGCHRRLLQPAVAELQSIAERIDGLVCVVYPDMRDALAAGEAYGYDGDSATPSSFRCSHIEPILHERVHDSLFALYRLNTTASESVYWNNVINLNHAPDTVLFKRFGLPRKLWLMSDKAEAGEKSILTFHVGMDGFGSDESADSVEGGRGGFHTPPTAGDDSDYDADGPALLRAGGSLARQPLQPGGDGSGVADAAAVLDVLLATDDDAARQLPNADTKGMDGGGTNSRSAADAGADGDGDGAAASFSQKSLAGERYTNAITTIQRIADVRGPGEKLNILHETFRAMSTAVSTYWDSGEKLSSMDDVLPVLLMVVVRAQIRELGAELQFLQDFLDTDLLSGESRILLTTLHAVYFQLQLEVSSRGGVEDPTMVEL